MSMSYLVNCKYQQNSNAKSCIRERFSPSVPSTRTHWTTLNEMSNDRFNRIFIYFSFYRFIRSITIVCVTIHNSFFLRILLLCCLCARQGHTTPSNWKRISFDSFLLFKFECVFLSRFFCCHWFNDTYNL